MGVLGVVLLLAGWSLFLPFASGSHSVGFSPLQGGLQSLSESHQFALQNSVLSSPLVQAILKKLCQQGWQEAPEGTNSFAFERAKILILAFTQSPPQGQTPLPGTPPTIVKPTPSEGYQLSFERQPSQPKPAPQTPSFAYLVYVALPEGEEAFAVLEESPGVFLHLYPDGDRRFRLFEGGDSLLGQLRQNERFKKFEDHLRTRVQRVGCGPVLLDEATSTAYIFVQGMSSSVATWSLSPAIYPPPSSYGPQEGAVYLVLARSASGELSVDPQSLWVCPYAIKNGQTNGEYTLGVGAYDTCLILAGGQKPKDWQDIRNFAYTVLTLFSTDEIMSSSVNPHCTTTLPVQALTLIIFCWRCADYLGENILCHFETNQELTIALYNVGVKNDISLGLMVKDQNKPAVSLLGFPETTRYEVQYWYNEALKKPRDPDFIEAPLEGVRQFLEERMSMSLEQLASLLLSLAQAEREGRFLAAYSDRLNEQRLRKLALCFWSFRFPLPYKAPEELPIELVMDPFIQNYIKALALRFDEVFRASSLQPQQIGEEGVVGILTGYVLGKLLDLLINATFSAFKGEIEPPFTRVFIKERDGRSYVCIGKTEEDLLYHWHTTYSWISLRIEWYGCPPEVGSDPRGLLSSVGIDVRRLRPLSSVERSWLAYALALPYYYRALMKDDREPNPAYKPGFHHFISLHVTAVDTALARRFNERPAPGNDQFYPVAVSVESLTDCIVIMHRYVTRETRYPWSKEPATHMDIAVVRHFGRPGPALSLDIHSVGDYLRDVMNNIFKDEEVYEPNPNFRPHGLDIVAVVLPTLKEDEVSAVKRLVEALSKEFEYIGPASSTFIADDKRGEAAFLIWREEINGQHVIVFSCFERKRLPGRGKLSKEEKEKIVRELTKDESSPVIEYIPENKHNSSNTGQGASPGNSPARGSNNPSSISNSPVMVGTTWSRSWEFDNIFPVWFQDYNVKKGG